MLLIIGDYNLVFKAETIGDLITNHELKTIDRADFEYSTDCLITCMKFISRDEAVRNAKLYSELGLKHCEDFILVDLTEKLLPESKWLAIKKNQLQQGSYVQAYRFYPAIKKGFVKIPFNFCN